MRSSVIKRSSYYSLHYVSHGVGFANDVVCGAEVFYTTAG